MPAFDPYHKWLGIPAAEQPPNHYRLLGLPLFESDLDVIEAAAERQTIFLRTLQIGPQSERAERVLNEVARARVTLLNVDQKLAYDAALRQQRTETEQQDQTAEPHSRESVPASGEDLRMMAPGRFGARASERDWIRQQCRQACANYYSLQGGATYSVGTSD